MDQRPTRPKSRKPVVFRDGLGRRVRTLDSSAIELEVLCLRPELSTPAHEAALRERAGRLANARSGSFARVRGVQRLNDSASSLALVSVATPGMRLSEILATSDRLGVALDGSAGWAIVVQLVSAVALMHEHAPDVAVGTIGPERIVITPDARVVVVEHVLGSLIETSGLSQEQAWSEFGVAMPAGPFDLRSDVAQIGLVALSLVLGRTLNEDEYPSRLPRLVESALVTSVTGGREPMVGGLRSWLDRALQLDDRRSFGSAIEAIAELHRLLEETDSVVVPLALEAFHSRLQTAIERDKHAPAPPVSVPAADDAPTTIGGPAERVATAPAADTAAAEELTVAHGVIAPAPALSVAEPAIANPALQSFALATESPRETSFEPFASVHNPAASSGLPSFWKEHPWSRQAAAAVVLTVLVGVGWAATGRGTSAVRAEPSQPVAAATEPAKAPEPAPIPEPVAAPAPALPEVEIRKTAAVTPAAPAPAAAAAVTAPAPAPPAVASGWVNVNAPQDLNVFENGALIGTSRGGRIRLPVGAHQIELVGESIGYRSTRTVQIRNNANETLSIELPNGTLSLNATPWAEVIVDGKSVGETPIGNLSVAPGSHDVVFRHPELGEKRMNAIVTLTGPTRLSADMRK